MAQGINAVDEIGDGAGVVCNSKGVVVRTDIKWGASFSNAVSKMQLDLYIARWPTCNYLTG